MAGLVAPEAVVDQAHDELLGVGVADRDATARSEHARHLGDGFSRIRIVVDRGAAENGGELGVGERERLAVADLELGTGEIGCEPARLVDHPRRQVEPDRPRNERRRLAHGRPGSAAHVQQAVAGFELERRERERLVAQNAAPVAIGLVSTRLGVEVAAACGLLLVLHQLGHGRHCSRPSPHFCASTIM